MRPSSSHTYSLLVATRSRIFQVRLSRRRVASSAARFGVTEVVIGVEVQERTERESLGASRVPFPSALPRDRPVGQPLLRGEAWRVPGCPARCHKWSAPTPPSSPTSTPLRGRGGRLMAPPHHRNQHGSWVPRPRPSRTSIAPRLRTHPLYLLRGTTAAPTLTTGKWGERTKRPTASAYAHPRVPPPRPLPPTPLSLKCFHVFFALGMEPDGTGRPPSLRESQRREANTIECHHWLFAVVPFWGRPMAARQKGGKSRREPRGAVGPPQLAGRPRRAPSRRGRRRRGRSAAGSQPPQPSAKGSGVPDSCRLRTALGVGEERWVRLYRRRCRSRRRTASTCTTSRPCVPPAALPAPRVVPAGASAPPFWTSRTATRLGARRCRSRRWAIRHEGPRAPGPRRRPYVGGGRMWEGGRGMGEGGGE